MTAAVPSATPDLMDLTTYTANREFDLFAELRDADPVHWNAPSDRGPGFWALTAYDDVKAAASDHLRLSSASGTQIVDRKVEGALASLHNMDDPEHAALRKVTIPYLRAVKIKQWQDVIDSTVESLLDEAEDRGSFDLVEVISARLPMLVLSQVLGVPADDAPKLVDWTNRMTTSDPDHKADRDAMAAARDELLDTFARLTEQRRGAPTNDLISVLVTGQKDGRPLTWAELAAYYIVLVAAGNETTRHLVSGGVVALHDTDGSWQRLAADPSLVTPAVEEMFRYVTPVSCMRRTALSDLTIRDRQIRAGEKVVLFFSAANRDPAMFAAPEQFRVDRSPNDHLTFGWGIHFCLGAHLARAEVKALFLALLRRGLRLDVDGTPVRAAQNVFRGWTSVPVRVRAAD